MFYFNERSAKNTTIGRFNMIEKVTGKKQRGKQGKKQRGKQGEEQRGKQGEKQRGKQGETNERQ